MNAEDSPLYSQLASLINAAHSHLQAMGDSSETSQLLALELDNARNTMRSISNQMEGYHICEVATINDGDDLYKTEIILQAGASELHILAAGMKTLKEAGVARCRIKQTVAGL